MSSSSPPLAPTRAASGVAPASFDFVSSDLDALSSHMAQCSAAQGRWPGVRSGLQQVHAIAAGRIVTLACIGGTALVLLATFA